MQRKPGFPVTNCAIKMPESVNSSTLETVHGEDDVEQQHRRQQLINFGHAQWGFKNWSWSVTKQDLDFVDFTNGKFCVGAVAFVSITVKTIDIHRENIGYATSLATSKGLAIYKSRKCAVTNALRETLLSFGGTVASELMECLEARAPERPAASPPAPQPPAPKPEPKVEPPTRVRKEPEVNVRAAHVPLVANPPPPVATAHPLPPVATAHPLPVATAHPLPVATAHPLPIATAHPLPPVATAHPLPGRVPPPRPPAAPLRPNSNEAPPVDAAEEEARAERKRRQRQAQEEFRLRQVAKQRPGPDEKELHRNSSSFDQLMMELPSQDIVIEETGAPAEAKRQSPARDAHAAKRRALGSNRLDIVQAD